MNATLLITFIALTIVNVILQSSCHIITVKAGRVPAAFMNALTYGLYTVVIVYTMCDLPLGLKAAIVAACNLCGVFLTKTIEMKSRKDKLWKIECTVPEKYAEALSMDLSDIPHSDWAVGDNFHLFNFYCSTQAQSTQVKKVADQYEALFCAMESQHLY